MLLRDPNRRTDLVINLIASVIFFIIIQPVMTLLYRFVASLSTSAYFSFVNSIYQTAALRTSADPAYYLLFALAYALVMYCFQGVYGLVREWGRQLGRVPPYKEMSIEKKSLRGVLLLFILVVSTFAVLMLIQTNRNLNSSFTQRVTILAPRITDQEEEEFMAMWAGMKTRVDYMELNAALDAKAAEQGVQLPRALPE